MKILPRRKTVIIQGIAWVKDSLNIDDNIYFTYDEAVMYAKMENCRLPTKQDFKSLRSCPHKYDKKLKGVWFANTAKDLKDHDKCLFIGYKGYVDSYNTDYTNRECAVFWNELEKLNDAHLYGYSLIESRNVDFCNSTTIGKHRFQVLFIA